MLCFVTGFVGIANQATKGRISEDLNVLKHDSESFESRIGPSTSEMASLSQRVV